MMADPVKKDLNAIKTRRAVLTSTSKQKNLCQDIVIILKSGSKRSSSQNGRSCKLRMYAKFSVS